MAKKKVVKKQPAKKTTQTQTQNVNVYYDSRAGAKRKPRKRQPKKVNGESKTQILPAPIINYPPQFMQSINPNWFTPPPIPQSIKQYAVLPEGETAALVNLNPAVPVPLRIETNTPLLNAPIAEPNLTQLVAPPPPEEEFAEDDVSVLTEAPEFAELPEEAEGQVLDLPPAETSALIENKEPLFDPFNLPVPATSGRSLAESIAEPPTEAGFSYPFSVGETGYVELLPQSRFLGTLPPIKTAEKIELPFTPLPPSGLTVPKKEKPTPYLGKEPPPVIEAPKKGRPKGAKSKPKEEPTQTLFSVFPTTANVEPLGIPIQIGQREEETFKYSPPLSQLEGQYQFLGQPPPPTEKETNPLERRRGGGVLSAAEEAIIGGIPTFITGR